jgi:hypothetical protein
MGEVEYGSGVGCCGIATLERLRRPSWHSVLLPVEDPGHPFSTTPIPLKQGSDEADQRLRRHVQIWRRAV